MPVIEYRIRRASLELLRKKFSLDGTGRLLDLGTGTGELAVPLCRDFEEVVAVEPDADMIEEGKQRAAKAGARNISWVKRTAEEYVDRPGSFRLVTIGTALHWMEKKKVLAKVYELLMPCGGLAVVSRKGIWKSDKDWQQGIVKLVKTYLGEERRAGTGTFPTDTRRFEDIITECSFSKIETHNYKQCVERNINQIIGNLYSTSFARRELFGDRIKIFEKELARMLRGLSPSGKLKDERSVQAILAWK